MSKDLVETQRGIGIEVEIGFVGQWGPSRQSVLQYRESQLVGGWSGDEAWGDDQIRSDNGLPNLPKAMLGDYAKRRLPDIELYKHKDG